MTSIEDLIRQQLERMGIEQPTEEGAVTNGVTPAQRVAVEELLSAAIGDRPTVGPVALNNDAALGAIAGGPGAKVNQTGPTL